MKSGNLNFMKPSGPLQACNGTALPLPLPLPMLPIKIKYEHYTMNTNSTTNKIQGKYGSANSKE